MGLTDLQKAVNEWAAARREVESYRDETWNRLADAEARLAAMETRDDE